MAGLGPSRLVLAVQMIHRVSFPWPAILAAHYEHTVVVTQGRPLVLTAA